jgi:hypothetical protein
MGLMVASMVGVEGLRFRTMEAVAEVGAKGAAEAEAAATSTEAVSDSIPFRIQALV